MGSSPSKPHFTKAPATGGSSKNGAKSPDDHPQNDPPSCGHVDLKPSANVTKSGIPNTDRTDQADTVIAPVVDQRDQSLTNQSSRASSFRHQLKPTFAHLGDAKMSKNLSILTAKIGIFFQNNHCENSQLKTAANKRYVLKSILFPAKVSKSFDYFIRNMRPNTPAFKVIACPVVLGARTVPDSSRISTVNGIPWGLMEHEVYRVMTFLFYPEDMAKSSLALARSGFVYIGDGENDSVICFYCLKVTENWQTSESLGGLHEVTCRHLIASDDASLIDMQVLQNTDEMRLGFQSGPGVSIPVPLDGVVSQPKLTVDSQPNIPGVSQPNLPVRSPVNLPAIAMGLELTEGLCSNIGEATSEALGGESLEDRENVSGVGRRAMARSNENLSSTNEPDTEGNTMTEAMSPTANISQLRSKPRESNNLLEVIHENEISTSLKNVKARQVTKIVSIGRRYSSYSINSRPRMTRRGSV